MVIAIVLRIWGLGQTNLWFDEANSWEVARLPWHEMFANLRGSPVGPLYFALLKLWELAFGESEAALRALSLVAGVILLPVTYALGVRLLSRRAAALGALFVTLSPLHLYLSQEARMYMLLTVLGGACVLAYVRWRDAITAPEERPRSAALGLGLYALAALAILFTNVVAAPLLVAVNVDAAIVLLGRRRASGAGRAIAGWVATNAAVAAIFLIYLLGVAVRTAVATQFWRPPLGAMGALRAFINYPLTTVHGPYFYPDDFTSIARQFLHQPTFGIVQQWQLLIVAPLTLLAIVAALGRLPRTIWRDGHRLLLLAVIVPIGAGAIISIARELDLGRYMLFASPFLFLLIGDGLTRMRIVPRALTLAVILVSMALGVRRYESVTMRDSDYRPVAQLLKREPEARDPIVAAPGVPMGVIEYYVRGRGMPPIGGIPNGAPPATWLATAPATPVWLLLDYRSPLFAVSPDSLQAALGAQVMRDRPEAGMRMVLVRRTYATP